MIRNLTRGTVLSERTEVARGPVWRGIGLMGRRGWTSSDALVIDGCNSIHTCFMLMPIDVLFLDGEGTVLRGAPSVKPWRVGPASWRAKRALELPIGTIARTGTIAGDRIEITHGS